MNRYVTSLRYVPECITILNVVGGGGSYTKGFSAQVAKELGMDITDREKNLVEELCTIQQEVEAAVAPYMDDIRYYFSAERNADETVEKMASDMHWFSPASILFLCDPNGFRDHTQTIAGYRDCLLGLTEEEYNLAFYKQVRRFGSTADEDNDLPETVSMTDILNQILTMCEPDSTKLKIQAFYLNHAEHLKKAFGYLEIAEGILKKHAKTLEKYAKETVAYLKSHLGDQSFLEYAMSFWGPENVDQEALSKVQCTVYISYMLCVSMSISWSKEADTADGVVGAMFGEAVNMEIYKRHRKQLTDEKANAILKLLADKSKFEILATTRRDAAYGAELASRLGLTTATISHHTGALLQAGLLSINRVDNRIYYRANEDTVHQIIDYLESTLL